MLTHVYIQNFTIIDELELDFLPNMSVITGETGAGKSIMIDAIELALGQRATGNIVRTNHDKAEIHLTFDLQQLPTAKNWLAEHELGAENECLIRRIITKEGRSKSYINGLPCTLPLLKELGEQLINIHGQHEFQNLSKPELQRILLDEFGQHGSLCQEVSQHFKAWEKIQTEYSNLKEKNSEAKTKADYLKFQLEELNELSLTEEKLAALEQEQKQLANVGESGTQIQQALNLISEETPSAITLLNQALQATQAAEKFNPELSDMTELLNTALLNIEEASRDLQHHAGRLQHDPNRLAIVEEQLSRAYQLARKHHIELKALPALHQKLLTEFDTFENLDGHLASLEKKRQELQAQYSTAAKKLTTKRKASAKKFGEQITEQMQLLSMVGGKFIVELTPLDDKKLHSHGMEKIQFMVSTNPGQPAQPLQAVASGGELSRMSLAIQVIAAQLNTTPTLIFDEVDVGIGGATADIVGKLLRRVGEKTQVMCVTHLPQVAAKGHHHFKVEKQQRDNQTYTTLTALAQAARVQEIARMAGGTEINKEALAHAESLLEMA